MPTIPHGPYFENPANPTDPRCAYNRRWRFLYYLSGVGMMLYNRLKFGMGVDIYVPMMCHLLSKDDIKVERDVSIPLYWDDEKTLETCTIPLLINGNIIVDVYSQPDLPMTARDYLKNRMSLTHTTYGMIMNFESKAFFSEWYYRDSATGQVERVSLIK